MTHKLSGDDLTLIRGERCLFQDLSFALESGSLLILEGRNGCGKTSLMRAIAGMLSGLIFTMAYIIWFKGVFVEPFAANVPENWLFGISPEGIGALGALINFSAAIGVSALTPPPSEEVRALVERIRTPS